jgi:cytochrome c oxidase subunit 2
LQDGRQVTADEAYLRTAILRPRDTIVTGYEPLMPSYAGIADAADVEAPVAYLKSLDAGQED